MKFFYKTPIYNNLYENTLDYVHNTYIDSTANNNKQFFIALTIFYTNYYYYFSKNNKKIFYKLNQHSYLKKFLNLLCRHGCKLTVLNCNFFSFSNMFFSNILYSRNQNIIITYTHFYTFLYNIENYRWLRSTLTLIAWASSWLDYIFKPYITHKSYKAGYKKVPKAKIVYISTIKRPLIFYYFYKNFIKLSYYRGLKNRFTHIFLDTIFNYKNSKLFSNKIGIYTKYIQKTTKR
jgi:hypothetical protein